MVVYTRINQVRVNERIFAGMSPEVKETVEEILEAFVNKNDTYPENLSLTSDKGLKVRRIVSKGNKTLFTMALYDNDTLATVWLMRKQMIDDKMTKIIYEITPISLEAIV